MQRLYMFEISKNNPYLKIFKQRSGIFYCYDVASIKPQHASDS